MAYESLKADPNRKIKIIASLSSKEILSRRLQKLML